MARSRAAPSKASAAPHSAPRPAAPAASSHQQQTPHQPQVTNVYVQRAAPPMGGGMMGGGGGMGILGTVASVAAGSVVGHGISNMLFNKPTEPAQAQAAAQQYGEGACGSQIKSYAKCMEVNGNNSQQCNWAWDMFQQCQQDAQGKA